MFGGMNITPTEKGLIINDSINGWFENNFIHFKFRVKGRKITVPWLIGVARSIFLIDKIKEHDWLRRRGGIVDPFKLKYNEVFKIFKVLISHKDKFYNYATSDFTTNSRFLIKDLVTNAINNDLVISNSNDLIGFEKIKDGIKINCTKESFVVKKLVICNGKNISQFVESTVHTSYAPMAVINNIKPDAYSFVELDYFPKNCINLITKEKGVGLIGGISFSNRNECDRYIEEVIDKHKEYNPGLEVLHKYVGIKSEILVKKTPRNYLYHILNLEENVWGIIPGKFSLSFSIAPEFYRRVYKRNPKKHFKTSTPNEKHTDIVANTVWYDVIHNNS